MQNIIQLAMKNRRVLEQMISNLMLVLFSFVVEAGTMGKGIMMEEELFSG